MDELIFENGTYKTPPRRASFIGRMLPSLTFYPHLVSLVVRGSAKARRGQYGTPEWCGSSLESLRALEGVGVNIEIAGVENFQEMKGPCVFIGNHMSTLETFVLPVIISSFLESTFIVKQSLVDYPVFKHIMRSRDPITVGRENPRDDLRAVLEGGTERLTRGVSIIVFPQTTRRLTFIPAEFNTIGVKLAKRAGVPVVPIALKTDAWGNGRWLKDYGKIDPSKKVYLEFGKPLWIKDRGNEEHEQIVAFIKGKLQEWGGTVMDTK